MDTMSVIAIFAENPNFQTTKENKIYCRICATDTSEKGWQAHVENLTHCMAAYRFYLEFKIQGVGVCCRMCSEELDWKAQKTHFSSHKSAPDNIYKHFFANHILEWETQYYCFRCSAVYPDWFAAFIHIEEKRHQKWIKTEQPEIKSLQLPSKNVSYKLLTCNAVWASGIENVRCEICRCFDFGRQNIVQHIKGTLHKERKSAFASMLTTRMKERVDAEKSAECSKQTETTLMHCRKADKAAINESDKRAQTIDDKSSVKPSPTKQSQHVCNPACKNVPCFYYAKRDDGNFYCKICEYAFIDYDFDLHIAGKLHLNSTKELNNLGITIGDDNRSFCSSCKCIIMGYGNIYEHLRGDKHRRLKRNKESTVQAETLPATTPNSAKTKSLQKSHNCVSDCKNLPCMYVEDDIEGEIYCIICDEYLPKNDLIKHVTGNIHAMSVKRFNDNKITNAKGNDYHCGYCDCDIPGFDNISSHIRGNRHKKSQLKVADGSSALKASTEVSIKNKSPVKAELSQKKSTIPLSSACYIFKQNKNDSLCQICKISLSGKSTIDSHVAGNRHATAFRKYGCDNISFQHGNVFYCKCCNCDIHGLDNVYSHIKGYRHVNSPNLSASETKTSNSETSWDKIISSLTDELEGLSTNKPKPLIPSKKKKLTSSKKMIEDQKLEGKKNDRRTVCNIVINGSESLHTHLASHVRDDFVGPIDVEKTEQTSEKEQAEQNTVADSQTTLHSNKQVVNTGLAMDGKKTFVKRKEKPVDMNAVCNLLNFDKDYIYSLDDKLKDIELGLKLCYPIDSDNIYCLICRKMVKNTMQNYFDHLYDLNHCEYLDKIERDHKLFEDSPDELSELDLALEFMEEISDETVRCLVCTREFENADLILREHIGGKKHGKKLEEMRTRAKKNFELVRSRVHCNWYQVQRYSCVPCLITFKSEVNFVKHFECPEHKFVMKQQENSQRKMIIDFCGVCALLWFGYRCTYSYHRDIETHQWLERDGHYGSDELPESMKILLLDPEKFIEEKLKYYDEAATREREKEKSLIRDLEKAVKSKIPLAKVYPFGSRVTGVGSPESDIDVFLDCGNMYDGKKSTMDRISTFMIEVYESLIAESESWDVHELLTSCRSPIIKVRHRVTEISCDISFQNGLAVENTKLLKSFMDVYPSCRKMILFLKQWLTIDDLSGSHAISNYALYWFVVFYLQNETILPSVNELIKMKKKSRKICGWEVGVEHNFTYYNRAESYFNVKELLTRFFKFYANFDFRYEIASPLIGGAIKKRDFIETLNLPKEMALYVDYIKNSEKSVPFRIDSVMCIQDPFDLQYNVTRAVSKVYLSRFRANCSKSLDILCSTET